MIQSNYGCQDQAEAIQIVPAKVGGSSHADVSPGFEEKDCEAWLPVKVRPRTFPDING
jgi:hypothetical protein